jgi:restriction system protein
MLPVFVTSSKGEVRIGSVVEELADQLGLNPQERSELLFLASRHGHFRITPRGQMVLQSQPAHIDNKFLL